MNANDLHVVFGTGPVGMAVMEELSRKSCHIRMVSRSGQAAVPPGVEVVAANAADPASATAAAQGAAVIYFCLNAPDYHRWPQQFPPLQAGVIAAAEATGAKLVVMENLYMYGPHGGQSMHEDMPFNARDPRGVTRAHMARDLMAAHASGRLRAVSARASDFFGPRVLDSQAGERVFYPALAGKAVQILGDPDVPHAVTYMPDIGRALVTLGEHDTALGYAWHIPSHNITPRAFVEAIGAAAGTQPTVSALKKSPVRAAILTLLGLFNPPLRGLNSLMYEFDEPYVVDASAYEAAFGQQTTPLPEALAATVAWFRSNPPV
mgnify:CR=1 FL=1